MFLLLGWGREGRLVDEDIWSISRGLLGCCFGLFELCLVLGFLRYYWVERSSSLVQDSVSYDCSLFRGLTCCNLGCQIVAGSQTPYPIEPIHHMLGVFIVPGTFSRYTKPKPLFILATEYSTVAPSSPRKKTSKPEGPLTVGVYRASVLWKASSDVLKPDVSVAMTHKRESSNCKVL